MGKKWSASRVSTFSSCPLKYYYTYIKKWQPNTPVADSTLAEKGTCFHETVENYKTGMPKEDLIRILESKIQEYKVDETVFDERGALDRFFLFWDEFVAKKEKEGYTVGQESWTNGDIKVYGKDSKEEEIPFCGILDLLLYKDDSIIIYDYKSAKTPNASSYKKQLVLYAYLKGKEKGWTYQQMAERIKLYVFFPFSEQKSLNPFDAMLASVKQIRLIADDIESIINEYYVHSIQEANGMDWESSDFDKLGKPGFLCKWCDWYGSIPNEDGFKGCPASYRLGGRQSRGVKYHLIEKVEG